MISFTSLGSALYKTLMINVLIHTDLPEPVAPAIRRCGILAMSATVTFPPMSFPTAKDILEELFLNSGDSRRSRSMTALFSLFGTSIPTAAFPGIGASIRISAAARFSLISSARPTILLTLTPISGCNSYLVTDGPLQVPIHFVWTPKLRNASTMVFAFVSSSLSMSSCALPGIISSRSAVGGRGWSSSLSVTV